MSFSKNPGLKKFLIFSQNGPKFSENRNPKKILILQKMELSGTSGYGSF